MFGPYNLSYPKQDEHIQACGMKVHENKWDLIFDFTDTNAQGEKEQHHQLLDPSEFSIVSQAVEGLESQPVLAFPVPQKYGGNAADNDLNKKADDGVTFDIRTTSAADAQKIFEEQQRRIDAAKQQTEEQPEV